MVYTQWEARHGLSAAQFENVFNELNPEVYRLVKLSVYDHDNRATYAGIWQRRGGNEWHARNELTSAGFQAAVDQFAEKDIRPTHISVANVRNDLVFAAIWELQPGIPWIARHGLTLDEYQTLFDDLSNQGYRLRCISGYEVDRQPRFACIWDQYQGAVWQSWHGVAGDEFQEKCDDLAAKGFRLIQSCGYSIAGTPYFAGIWEESTGHAMECRHGLSEGDYQTEFDEMTRAGYRLVDVSGYSAGRSVNYTTIWEDGSADIPQDGDMSSKVIPFMQKYEVPGMSLAFARDGHIVATRCFGYANHITRQLVVPETRFRVASISKPITAAAIFKLIEEGRLQLSDQVLGPDGILGTQYGTPPYKPGLCDITVQQLLQHTSGGWRNDGDDPMFQDESLGMSELISWTLDNQSLTHTPGTNYAYSNFGYCLLGRIIETLTGESYDDYVRGALLQYCGSADMTLAGNTAADRRNDEALYVGAAHQNPYDMNVRRMDSHGGWLATASELVHFALAVDNFEFPSDILKPETISQMTAPSACNDRYACGWSVNASDNWWHTGGLPGTRTILVRTSGYKSWAALCNTRHTSDDMGTQLDELMWEVDALL